MGFTLQIHGEKIYRRFHVSLFYFVMFSLTGHFALAQQAHEDIEQRRGHRKGWTFTVGENRLPGDPLNSWQEWLSREILAAEKRYPMVRQEHAFSLTGGQVSAPLPTIRDGLRQLLGLRQYRFGVGHKDCGWRCC